MLDQRGQLLRVALGLAGCSMPSYDRALHALRTWLDSWAGTGHVAVGTHRHGDDLQLTQYDDRGWRTTFYTTAVRAEGAFLGLALAASLLAGYSMTGSKIRSRFHMLGFALVMAVG